MKLRKNLMINTIPIRRVGKALLDLGWVLTRLGDLHRAKVLENNA